MFLATYSLALVFTFLIHELDIYCACLARTRRRIYLLSTYAVFSGQQRIVTSTLLLLVLPTAQRNSWQFSIPFGKWGMRRETPLPTATHFYQTSAPG